MPMAFPGDRLMIDEHRGSDVSKAMKQFQNSFLASELMRVLVKLKSYE